ncbi:MAG: alanine racemase [Pseudomonadota bacterium]
MAHATLKIDLDAIAENWRALDAKSAAETGACVKADAYGLGVAKVAPALVAAGCRTFFVALAEEGRLVREVVGPDPRIFVFGGHMHGDAALLAASSLIPLLNSPEQITRHVAALPGHPFGVQLDSGMNRLGLEPADWDAVRTRVMEAGPALVMSHLACADEPRHPMNAQQRAAFAAMTQGIAAPLSLAATGGILLGAPFHYDLTRPGIGLYGGAPFGDARPAVQVSLPVIQVREVSAGETVGYGNIWTAKRDSKIATVSGGYADGLIRAIGRSTVLYAGDQACPLVGRVSMDLITADVTDLPKTPAALDMLGAHQGIEDLATTAGTIGYEILTSLGARYARSYVGA